MNRGISRFIPIIFSIVIFVLIIAAIISVIRIFTGGSDSEETVEQSNQSQTALLANAADRSVRMTVRGQIVGDNEFRSYRVTVSPSKRDFQRFQGYLKTPLAEKSYDNNTKAYDEFVRALEIAGMVNGTPLSGNADVITGLCANGVIYEYEVLQAERVANRLWTSSCGDAKGSLRGNSPELQRLFLAQTPDASDFIGKD